MDEIEDTMLKKVLSTLKSKEEITEFANTFIEQKSRQIAHKLMNEEIRANPINKKEIMNKRFEIRENVKRELLGLGEVIQEEMISMGLASKIPPSRQEGYEREIVNPKALSKPVTPENNNQCSKAVIDELEEKKKASLFPNMPKKRNDWFDAIYAMTEIYHEKYGEIPSIGQAWNILWNDPLEGHKIATKTVDHINYLVMGGNNLSEKSFKKRWRNYTTSPNKGE